MPPDKAPVRVEAVRVVTVPAVATMLPENVPPVVFPARVEMVAVELVRLVTVPVVELKVAMVPAVKLAPP